MPLFFLLDVFVAHGVKIFTGFSSISITASPRHTAKFVRVRMLMIAHLYPTKQS